MKRSLLIIAGIIIILLLIGVWGYLLFVGKENPTDVFGNLGITPADEQLPPPTPEQLTPTSTVDQLAVDKKPLSQLTTKPVIGFRYIERPGGDDVVVYAEEGTGHIYEINLNNRTETRISNTTIVDASSIVFSASGTEAVILAGDNAAEAFIGTLTDDGALELRSIPTKITNLAIRGDTVLFTGIESDRAIGRQLNLKNLTERVLFTAPFTSVTVAWGTSADSDHYVYPRPAASLPGYLYKAGTNQLTHTGVEGFGLSALTSKDYILVSNTENDLSSSYFIDKGTVSKISTALYLLPGKCVASTEFSTDFFCAGSFSDAPGEQPDDWLKGKTSFSDDLWLISAETGNALLLSSLEQESGRMIDVLDISLGDQETVVLFTNKLDNTLWMYDLKI